MKDNISSSSDTGGISKSKKEKEPAGSRSRRDLVTVNQKPNKTKLVKIYLFKLLKRKY